jgi:Mitochondrial carrier protein
MRRRSSAIKCYDHSAVIDSTICSNIDINWSQFAIQGAVAGGCRALSRALTFPFDTLKTLEQSAVKTSDAAETDNYRGPNESPFNFLVSREYFRGILPAVASAVPANAIFFMVYNYLQTIAASDCILDYLSIHGADFFHRPSVLFLERLIFSAVATLPQNAIKIPAELIKQRAQVQPNTNILLLVQQATRPPLGILGLYKGGGAQLIREIPYNAIQMATFQAFKEMLLSKSPDNSEIYPFGLNLASISGILGLVAAAIAAILTQPADVIKTKLMTDVEDNLNVDQIVSKDGIIRTARNIIVEEGWRGLFVGLTPRLILVSLGGMVYFWAAEVASQSTGLKLSK